MSAESNFKAVGGAAAHELPGILLYRPEVDGLRAIAVVAVILFHAKLPGFSGGYIGVDVFFVISGYLITSIILGECARGSFSIVRFYERRARRILPALFFVIAACLPLAWWLMTPSQMKSFSQSVVATTLFASNIYFWLTSGYFDLASDQKPLLHTWSLGVEEQFYLLFPLLVVLLWRPGGRRLLWTIVVLACASIALGILIRVQDPMAAFFLSPARAWQLMAGSLVACLPQRVAAVTSRARLRDNLLSGAGLLMIGLSIVLMDDRTPFPSPVSVLPILGAVLVLACALPGTLAVRLLSIRIVVGIGLVSYSAYLWHQPLFAFARIAHGHPGPVASLALVGASLLLARITWHYVEQPFRTKGRFSRRAIFKLSLAMMMVATTIGVAGHLSRGFLFRLGPEAGKVMAKLDRSPKREACHTAGPDFLDPQKACIYFSGKPTWASLGDSHVVELSYALAERLAQKGEGLLHLSFSGCPPALLFQWEGVGCTRWLNRAMARLEADHEVKNVIIAFRYTESVFGDQYELDAASPAVRLRVGSLGPDASASLMWQGMATIIERLRQSGKKVFVVLPVPELPASIERNVMRLDAGAADAAVGTSRAFYESRNRYMREHLAKLPWGNELVAINPEAALCDARECYALIDLQPMYFDDHHLSLAGARRLIEALSPYLDPAGSGASQQSRTAR